MNKKIILLNKLIKTILEVEAGMRISLSTRPIQIQQIKATTWAKKKNAVETSHGTAAWGKRW